MNEWSINMLKYWTGSLCWFPLRSLTYIRRHFSAAAITLRAISHFQHANIKQRAATAGPCAASTAAVRASFWSALFKALISWHVRLNTRTLARRQSRTGIEISGMLPSRPRTEHTPPVGWMVGHDIGAEYKHSISRWTRTVYCDNFEHLLVLVEITVQ